MTSSQISAAGAYAQADRLVVAIPVRAIDPTRRRFEVEDQAAAGQAPARPRDESEETDGQSASGSPPAPLTGGGRRGGSGLLGAFTSFLTRMFAQATEGAAASTSAQAGFQAYARAAGSAGAQQNGTVEILPPGYQRLASGRAIDLTV